MYLQAEASTYNAASSSLVDLNNYIVEVNRCRRDLKWIRDKNEIIAGLRNKRQSTMERPPDSNLKNHFETDVDGNGGDSWYNSFRRSECDGNFAMNHCERLRNKNVLRSLNSFEDQSTGTIIDNHLLINENTDETTNYQYSDEEETRYDRDLNDQESPTKNDLSHEANYKLSKFEQEHQLNNKTSVHNRRKRSLPNTISAKQSQGRPIAILSSLPIRSNNDGNKKTKKHLDEIYDDEIAFPEPMLAEEVLTNLGIKSIKKCKSNELNQTEVLGDEELLQMLSTEKTPPAKKNQIGITLELKVNNVTKQKIEAVTQLRRRKKSARNEMDYSGNKIEISRLNNIPNEVISAVFELVRSNEMLKQHVAPMLDLRHDPAYERQPNDRKVQ